MPGKFLNSYLVRFSQNGRMPAAAAADWGYKQGWRKVALVASDYVGGFDTVGGFADVFCLHGGQVAQEQYPPLGNPDYGPFLANLKRDVDAVVIFIPGADGLRFARQYIEIGLNGKIPLMDLYGQATYEPNLPQLGDGSIGIFSSLHYTPALKTPENERFVKSFMAKAKRIPSDNGPDGYVGAHAIADAANAVGGKVEDTEKFLAALKRASFPSPKGDIALDQYANIIQTLYIRKVEKVGNDLVNVPIASYPKMDQFWPFSASEFLSFKYAYPELKGKMNDCAKFKEKK
jgi:branched-chain amino acid transport system substrate-binding protein